MRLSLGLLLPALASAAQAAAPIEAYTFSASQPPTTETLDITPKQFRLVLAQRLGLARYHSIGDGRDVDAETVQTINRFGRQRSLFPADNEASPDLILALYTTDKEADEIRAELESHRYLAPAFSLNDAPGGQFDTLLKDFSDQITDIRGTLQIPDLASLKELLDGESGPLVIKHVTEPSQFRTHPQVDIMFKLVKKANLDVTILLVAENADRTPTGVFKTKQAYPWGKYLSPGAKDEYEKRQFEAPMADAVADKLFGNSAEATPASSPLRRIPLVCHASLDACNNATNACSGHGECYRKYGPVSGDSGPTCFACACKATYNKASGTTYWGGAACQKRDISAQFWIIAGFSLLLIGLVSWAIGMMFSIGNEKLPGVIGAGVAPKTR